jgi:hypothetical protein
MTDDLVKRLREPVDDPFFGPVIEPIKKESADRIEALDKRNKELDAFAKAAKGGAVMTDDLVKRLRHWQEYGPYRPSRYKEAADRIEQLEAALSQIAWQRYVDQLSAINNYNALQSVARAALGGANDAAT